VIQQRAEAIWHGEALGAGIARAVLAPFSYVFAGAVRVRAHLYEKGWLRSLSAPITVMSVGNLRVGGTGKTPTVLWLVERLRALGARPVVAMRGYGAGRAVPSTWLEPAGVASGERARVVSALGFRFVSVENAEGGSGLSDEALLVTLRGEVAVVSTPDRLAAARAAHAVGADVLVLDDGFQHRRLHRELDIVLTEPSEAEAHVLPAGPLREPWSALGRAHIVISPRAIVVPGAALLVSASTQPVGWVDRVAAEASVAALDSLRGREVVAVAGIARPQRFFDMLERCGVHVRERREFGDHHRYTREDWAVIRRMARAEEWVVTTEKDLVKLRSLAGADARLAGLRVEMVVEQEADLVRLLRATVPRLDASQGGPHDR
jgi:tetraacyldisaccharide 4'-kinase